MQQRYRQEPAQPSGVQLRRDQCKVEQHDNQREQSAQAMHEVKSGTDEWR